MKTRSFASPSSASTASLARRAVASSRGVATFCALGLAACNVSATTASTGGVGDAGGSADGGTCDHGSVVLLTDYMSTQIALANLEGVTQSASFLSTASTMASSLAFALSGDVALPHNTPASHRVVLIDGYGTNVLTWADPATAKVTAQLPVGTGFESNPRDYLETGGGKAYVTRFGDNAAPGKMPFDRGSDVLVLDTQTPAIDKSIPLPNVAGLPPRPGTMVPVGDTVIVAIAPLSDDFKTAADSALVGLRNEAIAWTQSISGLRGCDRPVVSPSGKTMAIACQGQLDASGAAISHAQTGIALYDVSADLSTHPPKLNRVVKVYDQLGSTVQSGVAWVSETVILGKTQTPLMMGPSSNQAFTLDMGTGKATVLLTANQDSKGMGKGIVYDDVLCRPGCGDVCLLADADTGKLRRWSITGSTLTPMSDVTVDPKTGLPPVALGGY